MHRRVSISLDVLHEINLEINILNCMQLRSFAVIIHTRQMIEHRNSSGSGVEDHEQKRHHRQQWFPILTDAHSEKQI